MNTRTLGTRHLTRTVAIAAFILMLALTTTQRAGANQSGPTVNEATQFQIALCEAGGGTATVEAERTVNAGLAFTKVRCTGGLLDGMFCYNGQFTGTHQCTFGRTAQRDMPDVETTGVFEEAPPDPVLTPVTVDATVDSGTVEEPLAEQPVVVEESVDPGTAEEPVTADTDGAVDDEPEIDQETVTPDEAADPIVDEPVIEEVPVVEESVDPGVVVEPVYEVEVDAGIEIEQSTLAGE